MNAEPFSLCDGSFGCSPAEYFAGTDFFTYTASDGLLASNPATVTLTVASDAVFTWTQEAGSAPALNLSAQSFAEGADVSLAMSASNPGGGTLQFAAVGLPPGLALDPVTGRIFGTVGSQAAELNAGHYAVTVLAADDRGSSVATADWTISATQCPVQLSVPSSQSNFTGTTVSLPVNASISNGDPLAFDATGLPSGLGIDPRTGLISGDFDAAATGVYTVTVTATDAVPATPQVSSGTFTWQVSPSRPSSVVFSNPGDQFNALYDSVDLDVSASDPGYPLAYSAVGLPDGLQIDPATGEIRGTVAASAYSTTPNVVIVTADDGMSGGNTTVFNWTVTPVSLTSPVDAISRVGDAVWLAVYGNDAAGQPLSYSATGLPGGLSIDPSSGAILGTVASNASATPLYTVDVTATDGVYSQDVTFHWTIWHANNHAPVLTNPGAQVNVVGDNVTLNLAATDAENDALYYSADGLPDGLDINNSTGVITGIVAEVALQTTPYAVTITVDDGNGGVTTQTSNWTVNNSTLTFQASTFTAVEGNADVVTIGVITDTDPHWNWHDFTATINWGDGTSDEGDVGGADGSYTVSGAHVYAHPGSYTTHISVSDGTAQVQYSATATVYAASLEVTGGFTDGAVVGASITGTWATFFVANSATASSRYTASINWGDDTLDRGSITGANGLFFVSGSHVYTHAGSKPITVTITDTEVATATTVSGEARVGDLFAGIESKLTVVTFSVQDTSATANAFSATINWGMELRAMPQ